MRPIRPAESVDPRSRREWTYTTTCSLSPRPTLTCSTAHWSSCYTCAKPFLSGTNRVCVIIQMQVCPRDVEWSHSESGREMSRDDSVRCRVCEVIKFFLCCIVHCVFSLVRTRGAVWSSSQLAKSHAHVSVNIYNLSICSCFSKQVETAPKGDAVVRRGLCGGGGCHCTFAVGGGGCRCLFVVGCGCFSLLSVMVACAL